MFAPADQAPGQRAPPSSKAKDTARIDGLIRQLGSHTFTEREAASKKLEALGEAALPALRVWLEHTKVTKQGAEELIKSLPKLVFVGRAPCS